MPDVEGVVAATKDIDPNHTTTMSSSSSHSQDCWVRGLLARGWKEGWPFDSLALAQGTTQFAHKARACHEGAREAGESSGAEERTRTFMGLRPLAPEASASANSATSAQWARETPELKPDAP